MEERMRKVERKLDALKITSDLKFKQIDEQKKLLWGIAAAVVVSIVTNFVG